MYDIQISRYPVKQGAHSQGSISERWYISHLYHWATADPEISWSHASVITSINRFLLIANEFDTPHGAASLKWINYDYG